MQIPKTMTITLRCSLEILALWNGNEYINYGNRCIFGTWSAITQNSRSSIKRMSWKSCRWILNTYFRFLSELNVLVKTFFTFSTNIIFVKKARTRKAYLFKLCYHEWYIAQQMRWNPLCIRNKMTINICWTCAIHTNCCRYWFFSFCFKN